MGREPGIVFCDLDDTFLSTDKRLIERNMAALDALAARGIGFVPCTGRNLGGVLIFEELASHPSVRYAVTSSGAVVYDLRAREVLHERTVGAVRTRALYDLVRPLEVSFDIFADGRIYSERWRLERLKGFGIDPFTLGHLLSTRTPIDVTVDEITARVRLVERISIFGTSDPAGRDDLTRARAAVAEVEGLRWTSAHPLGTEVVDARCSKGEALAWLCGYLGIDAGESVAFGDSDNDREMIEAAGMGVAMGNGYGSVRRAADVIAPANDEAGVAAVLEDLLGLRRSAG